MGLDECPAYVVVPNQSQLEFKAGPVGITKRCGVAGIRDRDHDVRVAWMFLGQILAEFSPGFVHVFAENPAVRPGKIDKFKDAVSLSSLCLQKFGSYPAGLENEYFTRRYIPDIFGAD